MTSSKRDAPAFTTIYADPPWTYQQPLKMSDGVARASGDQYATMRVEDICRLGMSSGSAICGYEIADVAFLWLWVTNPFLLDGTGVQVCRAWGFKPTQLIPWIKGRIDGGRLVLRTGMGHITRGVTEHLIIGTRGRYTDLVKVHNAEGLIVAPEESVMLATRGAHSAKPTAMYDLIERTCPGPYLELFARQQRPWWYTWGLEAPEPQRETEIAWG